MKTDHEDAIEMLEALERTLRAMADNDDMTTKPGGQMCEDMAHDIAVFVTLHRTAKP